MDGKNLIYETSSYVPLVFLDTLIKSGGIVEQKHIIVKTYLLNNNSVKNEYDYVKTVIYLTVEAQERTGINSVEALQNEIISIAAKEQGSGFEEIKTQ